MKKGDEVLVYTDWKELKDYQGKAILIERIESGDSFYLANERLKPDEGSISVEYSIVHRFFSSSDPIINRLKRLLTKNRRDRDVMKKNLASYLKRDNAQIVRDLVSKSSEENILKYFEQDASWQPTIYTGEKWLIEFIEDKDGWPIKFRTSRWFRIQSPHKKTKTYVMRSTTYSSKHLHRNHVDEDTPVPPYYNTYLGDKGLNVFE